MRVVTFIRNLAITQCGGTPAPVDGTVDRYAQDLFPDLTLIRERGLVEAAPDPTATVEPNCSLVPKNIPSYLAWMHNGAEWQDIAQGIQERSAALEHLKPIMAQCLRLHTGLAIRGGDPASFLNSVNVADQEGATLAQYMTWSAAYADCGAEYFAAFGSELAKRRRSMVQGSRDLLQSLAAEILAAGYTP
jgi:hypothetical protein